MKVTTPLSAPTVNCWIVFTPLPHTTRPVEVSGVRITVPPIAVQTLVRWKRDMVSVLLCAPVAAEIVAGLGTSCEAYVGTAMPIAVEFVPAVDGPIAGAVVQAGIVAAHVPANVVTGALASDGKRV